MDAEPRRRGPRFALRDVLVTMVVLCLLLSVILPAIQIARQQARRSHCSNNLLQIGLALVDYHDVHGRFPSAYVPDRQGQPNSSWRVAILPYISCNPFYDLYSFHEPWNSPGNLDLARRGEGYFYRCPADGLEEVTTNYLAVTGSGTAWPAPASTCLQDFSEPYREILVVESANTGLDWIEPRDLQFDRLDFTIRAPLRGGFSNAISQPVQAVSSEHPSGAHVVFADGSLEFLATETSPELLRDLLLIQGEHAIPLGSRQRCRYVPDPDVPTTAVKRFPYKLEWYTTDESKTRDR